jgi:hypothetical protein
MTIRSLLRTAALIGATAALPTAHAQQVWQQHEFFQNSESLHSYFYSGGNVSGSSKLELIDKKLPVDTSSFISAPSSLRLSWQSVPNGSWDVEVRLPNWPNRYIDFGGNTLYLWMESPTAIAAQDLPRLCLRDTANNFSAPLKLQFAAWAAFRSRSTKSNGSASWRVRRRSRRSSAKTTPS